MGEEETERERQQCFYWLIHSSNACNSQGQPNLKLGTGNLVRVSPRWVAGTPIYEPLSATSQGVN